MDRLEPVPRQRLRTGLLLAAALVFPAVFNAFSPYLVVDAARHGLVNLSGLVFVALFLSGLVLSRAWCGWACPGGGLMEIWTPVAGKPLGRRGLRAVKWALWVPWLLGIGFAFAHAGGVRGLSLLHRPGSGGGPAWAEMVRFLAVAALLLAPTLAAGRRGGCHVLCWMAPFLVLGRRLGTALGLPQLRMQPESGSCKSCGQCERACPMSLDVPRMVKEGTWDDDDCIQCARCADGCAAGAIRLEMARGGRRRWD